MCIGNPTAMSSNINSPSTTPNPSSIWDSLPLTSDNADLIDTNANTQGDDWGLLGGVLGIIAVPMMIGFGYYIYTHPRDQNKIMINNMQLQQSQRNQELTMTASQRKHSETMESQKAESNTCNEADAQYEKEGVVPGFVQPNAEQKNPKRDDLDLYENMYQPEGGKPVEQPTDTPGDVETRQTPNK
eukprot:883609_1